MYITHFQSHKDRERMLALVREYPLGCAHVVDLPYRLCSWALDSPDTVALWEDDSGRLLAWAVFQTPFWTLDYAVHPAAPPDALTTILHWANATAPALLGTSYGRPSWFVAVSAKLVDLHKVLEAAGYASQELVQDSWSQVTMALPEHAVLPLCPVKAGFFLRTLRGEDEVASYVALHRSVFDSVNMTESWRRQTLHHPAYRPELDLVIEDSSGELVAFCVGWIAKLLGNQATGQSGLVGQIEPIGVREDCRRDGLAWSIIAEAVRRMHGVGATTIFVQTDNYRDRAYSFYQAAGFQVVDNITIYRKDFG